MRGKKEDYSEVEKMLEEGNFGVKVQVMSDYFKDYCNSIQKISYNDLILAGDGDSIAIRNHSDLSVVKTIKHEYGLLWSS